MGLNIKNEETYRMDPDMCTRIMRENACELYGFGG